MVLVKDDIREELFSQFNGYNRRSDRLNTPKGFVFDILNGYIKKDLKSNIGIVTQRDGIAKLNSVALDSDYGSTKSIRVLFEAKWDGGGTDLIIRAGTAWGLYNGSDEFDAILTGRGDDAKGMAFMFKNEVILLDGGVPQKVTAAYAVSALSADGNMPQDSTAGWVHRDKVWLNSQAAPMKAYFCKTNSANAATSWTGTTDAGFLDLSTVLPVGDTIIGFRTYGGQDSGLIAIICRNFTAIYKAGANPYDFTFIQYFPSTCLSMGAAAYIGKDIVYPSRDVLTSLIASINTDNLSLKPLSDYISPYYRSLVDQVGDPEDMTGYFDKVNNFYYLTFPISNNYQTLIYSVDIGNFVGRWVYPVNNYSFCQRIDGTMLFGSDSYVYIMNSGTSDDGTAISWKLALPATYFSAPHRYKKPLEIELLVQATASLTLYLDYWFGLSTLNNDLITKSLSISASASLWDEALWDVSYWDTQGNNHVRTSDIYGRGRLMFIELRHNTMDAKISIPWFLIRYLMEGYN